MAALEEILWITLQNLSSEDFKTFKWFLKQDNTLQGFPAISAAALENADRVDVVDRMVENYGRSRVLQITMKVLEKIKRKDLQQSLSIRARDLTARDTDLLQNESEQEKVEREKRIKQTIKERKTKIQEIRRSAERSKASVDESKKVLSDLLQSLQSSLDNLVKTMEANQKRRQKQAEGSIQELERQITELALRPSHLPPAARSSTCIPPPVCDADTRSAVEELVQTLSSHMEKLVAKVRLRDVQQFAVDVTLDADTASSNLVLSDDAKQVHFGEKPQKLPDSPGRFQPSPNVLGRQGFSAGRFYFEVKVEGKISWDLGVVKESISRKGSITARPQNGFWNICLRKGGEYKANRLSLSVHHPPLSTVGVFVDYEEGLVSFYDVASADLIHCFNNCSFREKLFPFFSPGLRHEGTNSAPLIISTVCDADGQQTARI